MILCGRVGALLFVGGRSYRGRGRRIAAVVDAERLVSRALCVLRVEICFSTLRTRGMRNRRGPQDLTGEHTNRGCVRRSMARCQSNNPHGNRI
jgi:hypothetical protein